MIIQIIDLLFVCYTTMIFVRIISSWFPNLQQYQFIRFIYHYTEPYLGFFRRIIPPIGGMIDLSPLIGLIVLSFAKKIIISLLIS